MLGVIISACIFSAYVLGICLGFRKIPTSISSSYYMLEEKRKNLGALFTFFSWGTAIPMMIPLISKTSENIMFLPFIACAALCFVGAAPLFRDSLDRTIHTNATALAMAAITAWMLITEWRVFTIMAAAYILFSAVYMLVKRIKFSDKDFVNRMKPLFWIECVIFISTYITTFIII